MIPKKEKNERELKHYYVIDTCVLFEELGWAKKLGKALKKGELDGKEIVGEIIIPQAVREKEVDEKYLKLLDEKREKNLTKEQKKLLKKARKAKKLLDRELGLNPNETAWRVRRETKRIMGAARMLQDELRLYEGVGNPPGGNDLIILATAMEIAYYQKPSKVSLVTWDTGLQNAVKKIRGQGFRVWLQPNLRSLWRINRKIYNFQKKVGLKKNSKKKGDR